MQFMSLRFQGWKFALWFMATQCQDYGINCDIWRSVLWRACVGAVGHGLKSQGEVTPKLWQSVTWSCEETDGDGNGKRSCDQIVIKNDVRVTPCNTSELDECNILFGHELPMEAKVANAQIFFRGLWAISKEPSLHRGDTERSGELMLNIAAAFSIITWIPIHTVFQHCVFHWWEFQFPIFDTALALPTRRVSGPNKASFSVQDQMDTLDPLRTTTKSRHWVSWKQVKVATTRPEVKVAANAYLMHLMWSPLDEPNMWSFSKDAGKFREMCLWFLLRYGSSTLWWFDVGIALSPTRRRTEHSLQGQDVSAMQFCKWTTHISFDKVWMQVRIAQDTKDAHAVIIIDREDFPEIERYTLPGSVLYTVTLCQTEACLNLER